jgi:hypothetical protein
MKVGDLVKFMNRPVDGSSWHYSWQNLFGEVGLIADFKKSRFNEQAIVVVYFFSTLEYIDVYQSWVEPLE